MKGRPADTERYRRRAREIAQDEVGSEVASELLRPPMMVQAAIAHEKLLAPDDLLLITRET